MFERQQRGKDFLIHEMGDYRDVYDNSSKLLTEFGITREVCRALTVYFEGQQKERMNRILYILTVTTTILAPMQVCPMTHADTTHSTFTTHFVC
jgi:hypothetical protein